MIHKKGIFTMTNIKKYKKIVIKVGTSQLFDPVHLNFQETWFESLLADIKMLMAEGCEVFLVTSGSAAIPCQEQGIKYTKLKTLEKQQYSSIGMIDLLKLYENHAKKFGINDISPILLSIDDTENRKKLSSVKEIVQELVAKKLLPVFMHNDILSSAEIRFGDNDRFAAKVASFLKANLLILFSREDGLYSDDPNANSSAKFVKEVYEINNDVESMAKDSAIGTGGMSVKINAAKTALNSGCDVVIMKGSVINPINALDNNAKATYLWSSKESKMRYVLE